MGNVILTGANGWSLSSSGFSNPGYVSGPAGQSDPLGSTGFDISAAEAVAIAFEGSYTGATVVHEQTLDISGVSGWFPVLGIEADNVGIVGTGLSTTSVCYLFPAIGARHRIRCTALSTGSMVARICLTVQSVMTLSGPASGSSSGGPGSAGKSATITRPPNVTAYGAYTVIGPSAGTSAIQFSGLAGSSGGEIIITTINVEIDITAIPAGMTNFLLALYSVTPPSAYANGAAWDLASGDRASIILPGPINLGAPALVKTSGSTAMASYSPPSPLQVTLTGPDAFAYLITASGFTPADNSEVYKINLHVVGV